MAFLTKRGKYYYVKWNTSEDGKVRAVRKALGTRHKDVAQKMVRELEKLESLGKIDPFSLGFNPKRALTDDQPENKVNCNTVTEALELFYSAKQHLTPATIGSYKRALDHFVDLNGLEKVSPKSTATSFRECYFQAWNCRSYPTLLFSAIQGTVEVSEKEESG